MSQGYQALREGAGRIDLSSRGRIRVTGEDRARLLHAMTTNHVQGLTPGTGCYVFFLNAVGRVLADANILCFEDYFLIDTETEARSFLMEHLDKYIIADDVVLEDISESTSSVGIEGEKAAAVVAQAGLATPDKALDHVTTGGLTIVRATSTGAPGFRLIAPAGAPLPLAELAEARPEEANVVRLEHFFPRYGDDITAANLPQETGIVTALHFNKGCYLGQEIVERVRSRGHVNRILTGLVIEEDEGLERGEKVTFEGAEAGEITSSAYSPALGKTPAMAYLRVAAGKPGTSVSVDGRAAQTVAIKSSRI
jgi:aminomethyltransferase